MSNLNVCCIVLGVARSGTSLAAGLLQCLGVEMHGAPNPSSQNPAGSFEDPGILTALTRLTGPSMRGETLSQADLQAYRELLGQRARQAVGPWGFKTAETHYLLGNTLAGLNGLARPILVAVHRDGYSNARSYQVHLQQVYGTNASILQALMRVESSRLKMLQALSNYPAIPTVHLTYEAMRSRPVDCMTSVGTVTGLEVSEEAVQRARQMVQPHYCTWR